jgi:hypothetical protein
MITVAEMREPTPAAAGDEVVSTLRAMSLRLLRRMYRPGDGLFAFRLRKMDSGHRLEGVSRRYTAIVLIGLAGEDSQASQFVLEVNAEDTCERLLGTIETQENLGDVALTLWAARAQRHDAAHRALAQLRKLDPCTGLHPTVELAWALTALCIDGGADAADDLAPVIASRLLAGCDRESGLFPRMPDAGGPGGLRGHVGCFADQVYPIQALAHFSQLSGDGPALEAANRCARRICELQGHDGQWWWHYDVRTGQVLEGYPVYSVHQDAMAPMALYDLTEAGGDNFDRHVDRGMAWLMSPAEVGVALVDREADVIWRKVGRREPGKLSRTLQALASRVHPSFRFPGIATLFPPDFVDYESRPYHMGWLLYAFSPQRLARRQATGSL